MYFSASIVHELVDRIELLDDSGVPRFLVRAPQPGDVEQLYQARTDSQDQLKEFMPWAHFDFSQETILLNLTHWRGLYLAGQDFFLGMWSIAADGTESLVVCGGMHTRGNLSPHSREIGYWVPTPQTGNGYAKIFTQICIAFGFHWLKLDRIELFSSPQNQKSRHIAESLGFVYEGCHRNQHAPLNPEHEKGGLIQGRDRCDYSLIPEDIPARTPWLPEIQSRIRVYDLQNRSLPHLAPTKSPAHRQTAADTNPHKGPYTP